MVKPDHLNLDETILLKSSPEIGGLLFAVHRIIDPLAELSTCPSPIPLFFFLQTQPRLSSATDSPRR